MLYRVDIVIKYQNDTTEKKTLVLKSTSKKIIENYMHYRDERRTHSCFYNSECVEFDYTIETLSYKEISNKDANVLIAMENKKKRKQIKKEIKDLEEKIKKKRRKLNDD